MIRYSFNFLISQFLHTRYLGKHLLKSSTIFLRIAIVTTFFMVPKGSLAPAEKASLKRLIDRLIVSSTKIVWIVLADFLPLNAALMRTIACRPKYSAEGRPETCGLRKKECFVASSAKTARSNWREGTSRNRQQSN